MDFKLFESEIKVMELIWEREPISAKELSILALDQIGWNKNTTYTIIKKLEAKGYIKRQDPGFICTALIARDDVVKAETDSLINKLFAGSKKALFSALLEDEKLTSKDIEELRQMLERR